MAVVPAASKATATANAETVAFTSCILGSVLGLAGTLNAEPRPGQGGRTHPGAHDSGHHAARKRAIAPPTTGFVTALMWLPGTDWKRAPGMASASDSPEPLSSSSRPEEHTSKLPYL